MGSWRHEILINMYCNELEVRGCSSLKRFGFHIGRATESVTNGLCACLVSNVLNDWS